MRSVSVLLVLLALGAHGAGTGLAPSPPLTAARIRLPAGWPATLLHSPHQSSPGPPAAAQRSLTAVVGFPCPVAAAPLAVVRDPAAPKHCFTYTTKASDTVATLSRQLGVLFEALLRDNAPLRLSGNPRLAIKPKTPLRLCNVPKRFQDTQLQILNVIYDQFTAQGDPYRRVDTGLATYWVVPQPATYAQAAAFCAAQKGSLASITSAAENAEVAAAVLSAMALSQVSSRRLLAPLVVVWGPAHPCLWQGAPPPPPQRAAVATCRGEAAGSSPARAAQKTGSAPCARASERF